MLRKYSIPSPFGSNYASMFSGYLIPLLNTFSYSLDP